jgi:hypothetical protein
MKRWWLGVVLGGLMVAVGSGAAWAAQSQSTNYSVNEVQFGAGGQLNASSANYKAQQSLGSSAGGITKSANYWAEAGYLTPNVPFLELKVDAANIDLGILSSVSATTGTATFHVRTYVDSGYVVMSMNNPPQNESGAYLATNSSPTASSAGTEQFGINVVRNLTSCATPAPANFGADPMEQPDNSYANGQAAGGYNTCGLFKYVKGDVIAQTSGNGWGQTDYTISYIVNIAPLTKAGSYKMTQDLVAVATY